jgi:hypothetical protein
MTANRAILDLASRYRETLLFNIYQMGRDAIRWGSEDHWTFTPHEMETVAASIESARGTGAGDGGRGRAGGSGRGGGRGSAPDPLYLAMRAPERRDPRGFIIPSDQPDFASATRFVNALIKTGVDVHQASAAFTVAGTSYPAGSYVLKAAQAFRPHVMDMFEPQDHPDDFPYPGAAPTPPYDNAGYTLAFQMGVQFDRVLDGFDGPFVKLTDFARVPPGTVTSAQAATGYYFTHQSNNSFIAVNRLLSAKQDVRWLPDGPFGAGTFYLVANAGTEALIRKAVLPLGLNLRATDTPPADMGRRVRQPRIALYDQYGGSMPSGWTRLILEQFEFPYEVVFPPMLDAGSLGDRYDVIVFNGAGMPGVGAGGRGRRGGGAAAPAPAGRGAGAGQGQAAAGRGGPSPTQTAAGDTGAGQPAAARGGGGRGGRGGGAAGTGGGQAATGRNAGAGQAQGAPPSETQPFTPQPIPEEYRQRQGQVTAATLEQIRAFVEAGGAVVAIGSASMNAALQFGLPVSNQVAGLGRQEYYIPASVLRVAVDPDQPLAHGLGSQVDVLFNNNPVFRLDDGAAGAGIRRVAWFADGAPLRSGWAWGAKHLDQGVQAIDAPVGAGRLFLFGPEILFRAQPHGTFKFFFNALLLAAAE